MFVHPKPRRGIFAHIRLERIPAGLGELLVIHSACFLDLGMKHEPVSSVRQRLAVGGNNWNAGALMEPGVCGSDAGFQSETIDRNGALRGRHRQINQQGRAPFSPQHFVEAHDPALTRNQLMPGLFTQRFENRIEQRVLERLHDDGAGEPEISAGETEPLEIAVVITGDHDASFRPAGSHRFIEVL